MNITVNQTPRHVTVIVSRTVTWASISGKPSIITEETAATEEEFIAAQSGSKKIISYDGRDYYWTGTELKLIMTYTPETPEEEIDGNA